MQDFIRAVNVITLDNLYTIWLKTSIQKKRGIDKYVDKIKNKYGNNYTNKLNVNEKNKIFKMIEQNDNRFKIIQIYRDFRNHVTTIRNKYNELIDTEKEIEKRKEEKEKRKRNKLKKVLKKYKKVIPQKVKKYHKVKIF